jgi:WhiB family redox-sensing transcriptional regulator
MTNRGQTYREFSALIDETGGVPCQDIPEIFFPEDFPDKHTREYAIRTAKALCAECPLLTQCFAYAIEAQEPYGIWAGTLPHER